MGDPADDDMIVRITSPEVIQGDYLIKESDWGGHMSMTCDLQTLEDPVPPDGCPGVGGTVGWKSDNPAPILLPRRGKCAFVEKCREVQKAGGGGCMVISTDDSRIVMPSGRVNTDDIVIPTVMYVELSTHVRGTGLI